MFDHSRELLEVFHAQDHRRIITTNQENKKDIIAAMITLKMNIWRLWPGEERWEVAEQCRFWWASARAWSRVLRYSALTSVPHRRMYFLPTSMHLRKRTRAEHSRLSRPPSSVSRAATTLREYCDEHTCCTLARFNRHPGSWENDPSTSYFAQNTKITQIKITIFTIKQFIAVSRTLLSLPNCAIIVILYRRLQVLHIDIVNHSMFRCKNHRFNFNYCCRLDVVIGDKGAILNVVARRNCGEEWDDGKCWMIKVLHVSLVWSRMVQCIDQS